MEHQNKDENETYDASKLCPWAGHCDWRAPTRTAQCFGRMYTRRRGADPTLSRHITRSGPRSQRKARSGVVVNERESRPAFAPERGMP